MVKCIPVHNVSDPVPANYLENYSRFFKHSRYLKQIIIKNTLRANLVTSLQEKSVRSQIHSYSYLTAALKGGETLLRLALNSPLVAPQNNELGK
jgi:hypothetical protein